MMVVLGCLLSLVKNLGVLVGLVGVFSIVVQLFWLERLLSFVSTDTHVFSQVALLFLMDLYIFQILFNFLLILFYSLIKLLRIVLEHLVLSIVTLSHLLFVLH